VQSVHFTIPQPRSQLRDEQPPQMAAYQPNFVHSISNLQRDWENNTLQLE